MQITVFESVKTATGTLYDLEWSDLVKHLTEPREFASKGDCPLLKLATFANNQRSDANVLDVYGVELDYDAGLITVDIAAMMLQMAGIKCVLYTSPSHTATTPRWRVIAPLSRIYTKVERHEYIARLNGALGGVASHESFTAAQIYYFGKVNGVNYQSKVIDGQFLDLMEHLPSIAPIKQLDKPFVAVALESIAQDVIDDLRSALVTIDADDRATWIAVANNVASLGQVGLELWLEYSKKSAKYDEADALRVWSTLEGSRSGYQSVFVKAQAAGWVNPKKRDLSKIFGKVLDIPDTAKRARIAGGLVAGGVLTEADTFKQLLDSAGEDQKARDAVMKAFESGKAAPKQANFFDWREALAAHVAQLNLQYCCVLASGYYRVLEKDNDNHAKYKLIRPAELTQAYEGDTIQVGVKGKDDTPVFANKFKAWLVHPDRRNYKGGLTFAPNTQVADDIYNSYAGFAVTPTYDPIITKRVYNHIHDVVCSGNEEHYQYALNWIANMCQNPNKPGGTAFIVRGRKGTGKGLMGRLLTGIIGGHSLQISNLKHLVGSFNAHQADLLLLWCDEALNGNKMQDTSELNRLLTEPTLAIERKGMDVVQEPNRLHVYCTTNEAYAVPASNDERRLFVIDIKPTTPGRAHWAALEKDITNPAVQAAFLFDMLARDLTLFHPGDIPDSTALNEQREHSFNSMQRFLYDGLVAEHFDIAMTSKDWAVRVPASGMVDSYQHWCNVKRVPAMASGRLSRYLTSIYGRTTVSNGIRYYHLGAYAAACEAFEKFEKVELFK